MDKRSFVMYMSWMPMVSKMPDEQAGQLFKVIAAYQCGEDCDPEDPMVAAVFEMIRTTFEDDTAKYEETCKRRAQAGSHGGKQKIANASKRVANSSKTKQKVANATDNESEYDSDIDKDIKKHCPAEPDGEAIDEVVSHLNTACGTRYLPTTPKTRSLIKARLREHFTVADFKTVIDKKAQEWKGTEQEKYLRPETLFGTKFEGYLNQKGRASPGPGGFAQRSYDYTALERQIYGGEKCG